MDVDECRNVVQGQVTAIAPPGAGAGASLSPCVLGDWQHACHNFAGSFNCSCGTGYNGSWPACVDIDECAVGNGGCDASTVCTNLSPGRECGVCPPGYNRPVMGMPYHLRHIITRAGILN